jgi:hypothetical protein
MGLLPDTAAQLWPILTAFPAPLELFLNPPASKDRWAINELVRLASPDAQPNTCARAGSRSVLEFE